MGFKEAMGFLKISMMVMMMVMIIIIIIIGDWNNFKVTQTIPEQHKRKEHN
jgi:hypothetical protein